MNTVLQVRLDEKIKQRAKKAFAVMGLGLSSGVKMYLAQVARTQSIPLSIFTTENFSPTKKRRLMREAAEALKNGKRYRSAKELHDDILQHG